MIARSAFARLPFRAACGGACLFVLIACHDAPNALMTGPDDRPRQTLMCVQATPEGGAPVVQPLDANGGCPDGFDVKIWY